MTRQFNTWFLCLRVSDIPSLGVIIITSLFPLKCRPLFSATCLSSESICASCSTQILALLQHFPPKLRALHKAPNILEQTHCNLCQVSEHKRVWGLRHSDKWVYEECYKIILLQKRASLIFNTVWIIKGTAQQLGIYSGVRRLIQISHLNGSCGCS